MSAVGDGDGIAAWAKYKTIYCAVIYTYTIYETAEKRQIQWQLKTRRECARRVVDDVYVNINIDRLKIVRTTLCDFSSDMCV